MLLESGWKNEEAITILTGGEALPDNLKNELVSLGKGKAWNLYGPTEATIWATACELTASSPVTIGKPIGNTQAYILDSHRKMVPLGVTGELYLGGIQLARGYLGKKELTQASFVDDPFMPGERLYRTGDFARWLSNGQIEFLGRADEQVKIKGHRIELGEVEYALLKVDNVDAACVKVTEDAEGRKSLVAYIVSGVQKSSTSLRRDLMERIPEYMVPAYFVQLEKMPLTANGKVDKKALPVTGIDNLRSETEYVAPRNEVEERLVQIWKEVFKTDKAIGITDNYFELGGDSMIAIRMLAKISKEFKVLLSIGKLFEEPNIKGIANEIQNRDWFGKSVTSATDEEIESIKV
jgi:acyl-CoA synthetase (AMP-forming)/AMP-acid ligase II/acyl carrier protein